MPATTKKQQKLFGMALALERGKMPKDKASKKVKAISKGMSEKKIKEFAKTKHKGLAENHVLSFDQFINEAFIDPEGNLEDFEFDRSEMEMLEQIEGLRDFLEDSGAKKISYSIDGPILAFNFIYRDDPHYLELNLDTDDSIFTRSEGAGHYVIFEGDADELFHLIRENGLNL